MIILLLRDFYHRLNETLVIQRAGKVCLIYLEQLRGTGKFQREAGVCGMGTGKELRIKNEAMRMELLEELCALAAESVPESHPITQRS